MRKAIQFSFVLAGAASLASCGGTFLERERPDEFAVQRQAPLVIPPDFALEPPAPGAPRPTEGTAAQQALDTLFGGAAPRSGSRPARSTARATPSRAYARRSAIPIPTPSTRAPRRARSSSPPKAMGPTRAPLSLGDSSPASWRRSPLFVCASSAGGAHPGPLAFLAPAALRAAVRPCGPLAADRTCAFLQCGDDPFLRREDHFTSLTSNLSILRPSMSTTSKRQPCAVKCSPSCGSFLNTESA